MSVDSQTAESEVEQRASETSLSILRAAVSALRPRQWVKNLLVFAPVAVGHEVLHGEKLLSAFWAFVAFCGCASAVYIVNDLLDLEADRLHPHKRYRPFASGTLPLAFGLPLAIGCLALGLGVAGRLLPLACLGVLIAYVCLTSVYSAWLKRVAIVDVLLLAGLYTIRVLAGGLAADVPVSKWLMAFSVFWFLSLAFAKRYSELNRLAEENAQGAHGRGYRVSDLSLIESIGPTNGYLATLVFAQYVHSEEMQRLYASGWALWLICPLLMYWISRVWLKAKRGELTEDPVVFALHDRVSFVVLGLILVLIATARPL
jgi:4-hydroxybenzoate polyprenyltransferase